MQNKIKLAKQIVDKTATEVTSDYLYDFTLNKLEQIDSQRNLYNQLVNEIEQAKLNK